MSDYESIHGRRINFLSSDPTLTSSYEGQVWYNSATNRALVNIKAWSSSGPMTTARDQLGGAGTQTATVVFGGQTSPPTRVNSTEEYGGFTWFTGANLNETKSGVASAGTQTAALCSSGQTAPGTFTANVEEYNGSSWSEQNNLTTSGTRRGCGTQTAGLVFGGTQAPPVLDATEEYDGTNWTNGGSMNVARSQHTGCGIQTSALAISGGTSPSAGTGAVENYNGSSWTTVSSLNTTRYDMGSAAANADHALGFGGYVGPSSAVTEEWDGSSWTTVPATMGTARYNFAGSGTASQAVASGGRAGPRQSVTEEYNSSINAFTSAAFANGGNLSNSRAQFGSAKHGTQNAGLAFGGFNWPNTNRSETEEYGGSSWTSGGALPAGQRQMGGSGTQTAAYGIGGQPGIPNTTTLEYNGSSWTSGGALNSGGNFMANNAAGTQTAGLRAGGGPGASTTVEEYDGSSWTSANAMSVARVGNYFDGTQTAAVTTAGEAPSAPDASGSQTRLTEAYDGTNWSSDASSLFYLQSGAVSGGSAAQTAWMIAGGDGPNVTNNTGATQEYDGTAFVNTATMASPRRQINGGGTQTAGLVFGGTEASATALTATEEYTGTTTTVTASTLTTS